MRSTLLLLCAACLLLATRSTGQAAPEAPAVELPLRVIAVRPGGLCVIDRGARDAVEAGDTVRLQPRDRPALLGRVQTVDERTALVELDDFASVAVGTSGLIVIPRARLEARAAPERPPEAPEHPPWSRDESSWTPDMPLLAEVDILKPAERPQRVSGLAYVIGNTMVTSQDDEGYGELRMGADVRVENPFGQGGRFRYAGEVNYRTFESPQDDDDRTRLRFDRLSYSWGGTRWASERQEVGRFLQHGMPEFGYLDGYEWGYRFESGSRVGASFGAMPERNNDFFFNPDDIQLAGYYTWSADESERLTASAGFQKTWHEGDADRDLFIAKVEVLPEDGWTFTGTAWVDYYDDEDVKDDGIELTQVFAVATRTWDSGNGMDVQYTRQRYAELLRDEYPGIPASQLALLEDDDPYDRLAWSGWYWASPDVRLSGGVGAWTDEDEDGGDVRGAVDVDDLFIDGAHATVSGFWTQGEFTRGYGGRVAYEWPTWNGLWGLAYSLSDYDNDGFDGTFGDVLQHRVQVSREFRWDDGWNLRLSADAQFWDDETAWTLGMYLQKIF